MAACVSGTTAAGRLHYRADAFWIAVLIVAGVRVGARCGRRAGRDRVTYPHLRTLQISLDVRRRAEDFWITARRRQEFLSDQR